jgi:hypothetical protein
MKLISGGGSAAMKIRHETTISMVPERFRRTFHPVLDAYGLIPALRLVITSTQLLTRTTPLP